MAVSVKYWPSNNRHPGYFPEPSSFVRQIVPKSGNVKDLKIDSEARSLVTKETQEQLGMISPWESLIQFCHELNVTVVNKNDSITLMRSQKYHHECYFHWRLFKTTPCVVLLRLYLVLREKSNFVSTI